MMSTIRFITVGRYLLRYSEDTTAIPHIIISCLSAQYHHQPLNILCYSPHHLLICLLQATYYLRPDSQGLDNTYLWDKRHAIIVQNIITESDSIVFYPAGSQILLNRP